MRVLAFSLNDFNLSARDLLQNQYLTITQILCKIQKVLGVTHESI